MSEKRYAIVKRQRKCLYYEVISKKCLLDLEDCSKECINIKGKFQYGDTKEQLVKKVAQVMFREELKSCVYRADITFLPRIYERCLDKATKIVEFLGVE